MTTKTQEDAEKSKIRGRFKAGPLGLGDPDDISLRKVEVEILIPKKMREKAKSQKCMEEVKKFTECCRSNNLLMVVKCRPQNSELKDCLGQWYTNEEFKNECKKEYLKERSEFRRTGNAQKHKERIGISM